MDKLPNEIVYQIIAHLETSSLSRICQASKDLNALVGDRIYPRAIEQDEVDPRWPLSLTLAAAHNQLHAFKQLLEYSTIDLINSDITHKSIMSEYPSLWHMLVSEEPHFAPPPRDRDRMSLLYDFAPPPQDRYSMSLEEPEFAPPPRGRDRMSLLYVLTLLNREDMARMLLEKLGPFPYPPPTGRFFPANDTLPQLEIATVKGRIWIVNLLTEARPGILEESTTADEGPFSLGGAPAIWYLLDLAIRKSQIGIFDYLVDVGAEFLTRHWEEMCELILTARECDDLHATSRLLAILPQGDGDRGIVLEMVAGAFGGNDAMGQLFVDAGGQIEGMNVDFAANEGEPDTLQFLLKHGGVLKNPLHNGPRTLPVVEFLLDLSPELANSRDDNNLTPLDTVYDGDFSECESEVEEFVVGLIAAGGKVSGGVNPMTRRSSLQDAIYCLDMKTFEALLRLQPQQALIDSGLPQNTTAAQIAETASRQHTFFLAHALLKAGGDKHVVYEGGFNLMHIAAFLGQPKFVRYLLKQRVCASRQGMLYDFTPLHAAVYQAMETHKHVMGYANMMGLIILGDLTVTARDVGGGPELEQLSYTGYMEVVRLLVAAGVDVSCQVDHYGTALDIVACERILSKSGPLFAGREARDVKGAGQMSEKCRAALLHWILAPRQDSQEANGADSFEEWYYSHKIWRRDYDVTKWARERRDGGSVGQAIDDQAIDDQAIDDTLYSYTKELQDLERRNKARLLSAREVITW
ncbi:hypothetical protein FQN50_001980 [Emmonsiellopsis sp. PD_5]|nr:hypothetical protein FQN50_001980 [Emmonsiellopsis sp. PD_5]